MLRRGELLGIYPEGTRSPDGRLYRGKTGVARMALEAAVPVLPVAMIDTEKIQPPGRKRPTLGIRVGIKIGKPLDFSRYEGMEGDRFVLRSITDEIMYELMELSGQEYVDIYAQVAKDKLKAEKAERDKTAAAADELAQPAASDDQGGHAPAACAADPPGSPARPAGCGRIGPWASRPWCGARWRCSAPSACSTPSSPTRGGTTSTCTRSAAGSCWPSWGSGPSSWPASTASPPAGGGR